MRWFRIIDSAGPREGASLDRRHVLWSGSRMTTVLYSLAVRVPKGTSEGLEGSVSVAEKMAEKSSRISIISLVCIAFILGGGLVLFSMSRGEVEDVATSTSDSAAPAVPGEQTGSGIGEAAPPVVPPDFTLQAAATTIIRSSEFPRDRNVRLGLSLPVPATRFEPLNARIADENGRTLKAVATLQGEEMKIANLELETEWLSPGRYLIQLVTQELSHLPVRRYHLEVR